MPSCDASSRVRGRDEPCRRRNSSSSAVEFLGVLLPANVNSHHLPVAAWPHAVPHTGGKPAGNAVPFAEQELELNTMHTLIRASKYLREKQPRRRRPGRAGKGRRRPGQCWAGAVAAAVAGPCRARAAAAGPVPERRRPGAEGRAASGSHAEPILAC
uniref:Uncharacterized protein n=1 Tax=Oryza rufipogon TaxID=4529 RepID=A0A0E0QMN4_ORYRU